MHYLLPIIISSIFILGIVTTIIFMDSYLDSDLPNFPIIETIPIF